MRNKPIKVPGHLARSPEKLATFLAEGTSSDREIVQNIYYWITSNIRYDIKNFYRSKSRQYSIKQVLKRKKAICGQYAKLFDQLCMYAGVTSKTVVGYSKQFNTLGIEHVFYSNHAWNAVRLDTTWYLVDATWGSGYIALKKSTWKKLLEKLFHKQFLNNKSFFVQTVNPDFLFYDQERLITDHLPADPIWQLVKYPVSFAAFNNRSFNRYPNQPDSLHPSEVDYNAYESKLGMYKQLNSLEYEEEIADQSNIYNPQMFELLAMYHMHFADHQTFRKLTGNKAIDLITEKQTHYRLASSYARRQLSTNKSVVRLNKRSITKSIRDEIERPLELISNRINADIRKYNQAKEYFKDRELDERTKYRNINALRSKQKYAQLKYKKPPRNAGNVNANSVLRIVKAAFEQINNWEDTVSYTVKHYNDLVLLKKRLMDDLIIANGAFNVKLKAFNIDISCKHKLPELHQSVIVLDSLAGNMDSLSDEIEIRLNLCRLRYTLSIKHMLTY